MLRILILLTQLYLVKAVYVIHIFIDLTSNVFNVLLDVYNVLTLLLAQLVLIMIIQERATILDVDVYQVFTKLTPMYAQNVRLNV